MIYESVRKMTVKEQMAFDLGYAKALGEIERLTAERDEWKRRAEAAERDLVLAVSGHRCDICVNDECHYSDDEEIVACSAGIFKWRGPCAKNRRKEK